MEGQSNDDAQSAMEYTAVYKNPMITYKDYRNKYRKFLTSYPSMIEYFDKCVLKYLVISTSTEPYVKKPGKYWFRKFEWMLAKYRGLKNENDVFKYLVLESHNIDKLLRYGQKFFDDRLKIDEEFNITFNREFKYPPGKKIYIDFISRNYVLYKVAYDRVMINVEVIQYHRFLFDRLIVCSVKRLFRFVVLVQKSFGTYFKKMMKTPNYNIVYKFMFREQKKTGNYTFVDKILDLDDDGRTILEVRFQQVDESDYNEGIDEQAKEMEALYKGKDKYE